MGLVGLSLLLSAYISHKNVENLDEFLYRFFCTFFVLFVIKSLIF